MRGVMIEVPSHLLEERARTGIDRFDEMWEGELHMVPSPSEEHQRIELELAFALRRPVAEAGLLLRLELGLYDPAVAGATSYRQPDLVVFDPSVRSERGVEGAATLVVEIRSPGDESLEKLPFYERLGVAELVVVHRDTKQVRRWRRTDDRLVERPPGPGGAFDLDAVAVSLLEVGGHLEVTTSEGTATI